MTYEGANESLRLYLRNISKTPLLTIEEENALAEKIKNGDQSAREHMIKANLRLVVKVANDYANYGVPVMDLISEGNIGLMKAVGRFDPNKGAKLSTYAVWWIKQSIKRALANQSKTVRLPVHMVDKIARMKRVIAQLTEEFRRDPTDEEVADATGIPESNVRKLLDTGRQPTSLDAPINEGEATTYGEMICDEHAIDPSNRLSDKNIHGELGGLLDILKPRERAIIEKRFGLNGYKKEFTLEEVGAEFGVTRERIRQVQNIALGKMQRALKRKEKQPQSIAHDVGYSSPVKSIIETLSSQPTCEKAWSIIENSDIDVEGREKGLRSISVEKGVNWYSLGIRAIQELRKMREGRESRKKVTYADIETFLRANVFVGKR